MMSGFLLDHTVEIWVSEQDEDKLEENDYVYELTEEFCADTIVIMALSLMEPDSDFVRARMYQDVIEADLRIAIKYMKMNLPTRKEAGKASDIFV
ncbi:hypothetical protein G7Y89_g2470 [Cudoniella acicularis]|uniref:Uncharacterized protein n=1 Tax=Cudoniella acicularis TaxID=354080 RepID=A0A8H4W6H3_9HELO|nr:hypothetical protein G7Y89_g2470 [Cudoniella acicularis]